MSQTLTAEPQVKTATISSWTIDKVHTDVQFSVKHMMISNVRGNFEQFDATLQLGEDIRDSYIEATIQAASIDTHMPDRDAHLRGADFFDAEKYPIIRFVSSAFVPTDDGVAIKGILTMKDVSKEIVFNAEELTAPHVDPYGNIKIGLSATATINRKDFGLGWNVALEAGGVLVGENVKLTIDAQFAKMMSAATKSN